MFRRARAKASEAGRENGETIQAGAGQLDAALVGRDNFDAAFCTLGLSIAPDWTDVFQWMFDLVRPGGRVAVMNVYLDGKRTSGVANTYYRLLTKADSRRRFWEPLERQAVDIDRIDHNWFGGVARIAAGTKPHDAGRAERETTSA